MYSIDFLLIEDSINDGHFIERIIEKEKLSNNYKWLKDGEEALEYFFGEIDNPLPQFVLLDIKMPKVNGFEVLEKIKSNFKTKHIPIIIYSSSIVKSDIDKALELGANSYISKPPSYKEMKELFKLLFHYWISINKNACHD